MRRNRLLITWGKEIIYTHKKKESFKTSSLESANEIIFKRAHWNMASAIFRDSNGVTTNLINR